MKNSTNIFEKVILSFVFLGIVSFIVFLIQFSQMFDYEEDKLKFNKVSWADSEEERHFMLDDLKENYLRPGTDSTEIKRLLGEPERHFGFSYRLGYYISGLDPTFLILEFDGNGKLKNVTVQTI